MLIKFFIRYISKRGYIVRRQGDALGLSRSMNAIACAYDAKQKGAATAFNVEGYKNFDIRSLAQ